MISMALMSFVAGNVAILSPCVLPAVPFIVSSAFQQHKWGPIAIALGLITAFTGIGASIAMFGSFLGIDQDTIRVISAIMLILMGVSFFSKKVQQCLNVIFNKLANKANTVLNRGSHSGLRGQFILGLMVGAVWSPCIGPTLGGAIAMAGQTESRMQGATLILIYGLGIVLPFIIMAYGARFVTAKKMKASQWTQKAKTALGLLMIAFGISVLTGLDKKFEGIAFEVMPSSVLNFITSF